MLNKLSFKLALRFMRSKRHGALARFMSLASTAGIATGTAALIIGLSAMNGFEYELNNRVLSLIPAGTITSKAGGFDDIDGDLLKLKHQPGVTAAAPVVSLKGVLSKERNFSPVAVIGISEKEKSVISLERFMDCSIDILQHDESVPSIIVGNGIALKLGLKKGSEIRFIGIDSQNGVEALGKTESSVFKVAGFFKTGGQIDGTLAFININQALKSAGLTTPNTIHLGVSDMMKANQIVNNAAWELGKPVSAESWIKSQGKLYGDIWMIRHIMYMAMILVIAVACFNIVSNLIMSISEKRREIAILLTMGMTRRKIISCFTCMGVLSGLSGTIIGLIFGCSISLLLTPITSRFKEWFGFSLLNEDVYFINFIPSSLKVSDILMVSACALLMSFIASIYPAFKASKINPSSELNG